jgi:hypothetical protein
VVDAPTPLQQSTNANTARVALQLTGQVGRFVWGTTGSYSRLTTNSSGAIGLDDSGNLVFDRTDSTLNTEGLQFSGQSALLPALSNLRHPALPAKRSGLKRAELAHFSSISPIFPATLKRPTGCKTSQLTP